jgi:proteasome lid subunit RPN8/RPN11
MALSLIWVVPAGEAEPMIAALVRRAIRFLSGLSGPARGRAIVSSAVLDQPTATRIEYRPLQRAVLTDGVGRTLFEDYEAHRQGERGQEETGWVLLGLREAEQAVVVASLPAGNRRDAGSGHIQFSSEAQILGTRILRQADRRLTVLGVVHTHPGSLRHPSDEDYRGDRSWVGRLRGEEGIFAIGTGDNKSGDTIGVAQQPRHNVQCFGALRFTWYSLTAGADDYRALTVAYTLGPDLARPLHGIWSVLETHAGRIERLCRQQAGMLFDVVSVDDHPCLELRLRLSEPAQHLRILVDAKSLRYYVQRNGKEVMVDPGDEFIDRAVYLLLAELARNAD